MLTKNISPRFFCLPLYLLLFLSLTSGIIFPQNAFAVTVTFKALNQYGKPVKGAHITVKGYGSAVAGKSVHIKAGKKIFFSGSISGIEGRFISQKITRKTRELVYPFVKVEFFAQDQNGKNIPGSMIYVDGFTTIKSGGSMELPEGVVVPVVGKIFGLEGRYIYNKIDKENPKVLYPFVSLPFYARSESGKNLPEGSIYIEGFGNVKSGDVVSIPDGVRINYKGKMSQIYGVTYSKSIHSGVKEVGFPFKSVGFTAKDQHGRRLRKVNLHVTGIGSVASGTRLYLPKGAKISYKIDLLSDPGSSINEKYAETGSGKKYKIQYAKNAFSPYVSEKVTKNFSEALIPVEIDYGIPVADAGRERILSKGRNIFLDGSASYSQASNPLTYTWKQIGGPPVTIGDPSQPKMVVTLPDEIGQDETLIFALVVTDGSVNSQPDTIKIRLDESNIIVANSKDDWSIDF